MHTAGYFSSSYTNHTVISNSRLPTLVHIVFPSLSTSISPLTFQTHPTYPLSAEGSRTLSSTFPHSNYTPVLTSLASLGGSPCDDNPSRPSTLQCSTSRPSTSPHRVKGRKTGLNRICFYVATHMSAQPDTSLNLQQDNNNSHIHVFRITKRKTTKIDQTLFSFLEIRCSSCLHELEMETECHGCHLCLLLFATQTVKTVFDI